jgi:S1-C subfamily serine protease
MRKSREALAIVLCGVVATGCGVLSRGAAPSAPVTVTVTAAPPSVTASPTHPGSFSPTALTKTPTPVATLQNAYDAVRKGVVRFEVATCRDDSIGSGYQVSPTLVVTAAHVVVGAEVIRMISGRSATAGDVVGVDSIADVALVEAQSPLTGPSLRFSRQPPHVGDPIGAIGFPEGDPLSFNEGTISGLDRKAVIDGIPRHSMIEMDATTTHGSSGGPVIKADGSVVGLVDAAPDNEPGRRLAVSSSIAEPLVERWMKNPKRMHLQNCDSAVGPDGQPVNAAQSATTAERDALTTLEVYFRSINNGDFSTAFAQLLTPGKYKSFQKAVTSSQDSDFVVQSLDSSNGTPVVSLDFTSRQDPGQGPKARPQETCTRWSLEYTFGRRNGLWLIRSTQPAGGNQRSRPC